MNERITPDAVKAQIGKSKKGVPMSPAHLAARTRGRKPKFSVGDDVLWFDDAGTIDKVLGILYDNGIRAIWYTVRFGNRTRDLTQEVLQGVKAVKCKCCNTPVSSLIQGGEGYNGCCSPGCAQAERMASATDNLRDELARFFLSVDMLAGYARLAYERG